jgi:hypothetical protein
MSKYSRWQNEKTFAEIHREHVEREKAKQPAFCFDGLMELWKNAGCTVEVSGLTVEDISLASMEYVDSQPEKGYEYHASVLGGDPVRALKPKAGSVKLKGGKRSHKVYWRISHYGTARRRGFRPQRGKRKKELFDYLP